LRAQHLAQVAGFGAENVLPDRLIAEERQGVSDELARTAQLFADGGDENGRARRHGGMINEQVLA
jgi:hypothetical protein